MPLVELVLIVVEDARGDLGDWLRRPLCASQRLRSGRGGSGHTVPSSRRNPQICRRDGDMGGVPNGDSGCASSSVVARMPLYLALLRLSVAPSGLPLITAAVGASHSRLLAMRISEVRNHEVKDKLLWRFGSGEARLGAGSAGERRYGKQELDDRGSGPGKMGESAPSGRWLLSWAGLSWLVCATRPDLPWDCFR